MPRTKANSIEDDWFLNCIACIKLSPSWSSAASARQLNVFFLGYMKARDDLGLPEYGAHEGGLREEFRDWLCAKVGQPTRVGWVYCVEQIDGSPGNIATFVALFEEFLAAKGRTLPPADLKKWVGEDLERSGS